MYTQKYSSRKGRSRLSRNKWNLNILLKQQLSKSIDRSIIIDSPYGPLSLDKSSNNKNSKYITSEYKEQFIAHQNIKSYYGDLNHFQIQNSLLDIESRLDVLVYRTGIPSSLFEARNLIRHKKVFVNHSLVTNIFTRISLGSSIVFQSPNIITNNNAPASHLLVKRLPKNTTIAIYKKPIHKMNLRYPKDWDVVEKFHLKHSI